MTWTMRSALCHSMACVDIPLHTDHRTQSKIIPEAVAALVAWGLGTVEKPHSILQPAVLRQLEPARDVDALHKQAVGNRSEGRTKARTRLSNRQGVELRRGGDDDGAILLLQALAESSPRGIGGALAVLV